MSILKSTATEVKHLAFKIQIFGVNPITLKFKCISALLIVVVIYYGLEMASSGIHLGIVPEALKALNGLKHQSYQIKKEKRVPSPIFHQSFIDD